MARFIIYLFSQYLLGTYLVSGIVLRSDCILDSVATKYLAKKVTFE